MDTSSNILRQKRNTTSYSGKLEHYCKRGGKLKKIKIKIIWFVIHFCTEMTTVVKFEGIVWTWHGESVSVVSWIPTTRVSGKSVVSSALEPNTKKDINKKNNKFAKWGMSFEEKERISVHLLDSYRLFLYVTFQAIYFDLPAVLRLLSPQCSQLCVPTYFLLCFTYISDSDISKLFFCKDVMVFLPIFYRSLFIFQWIIVFIVYLFFLTITL